MMPVTDAALYQFMTWLSPSYPVGAFTYSQGLEAAVAAGLVHDMASMAGWLDDSLQGGPIWSDAVIFGRAHDAGRASTHFALLEVANFAVAFQPAAELKLETLAQGNAFVDATARAWPCKQLDMLQQSAGSQMPYPVAVAVAAAGHGIALEPALHA